MGAPPPLSSEGRKVLLGWKYLGEGPEKVLPLWPARGRGSGHAWRRLRRGDHAAQLPFPVFCAGACCGENPRGAAPLGNAPLSFESGIPSWLWERGRGLLSVLLPRPAMRISQGWREMRAAFLRMQSYACFARRVGQSADIWEIEQCLCIVSRALFAYRKARALRRWLNRPRGPRVAEARRSDGRSFNFWQTGEWSMCDGARNLKNKKTKRKNIYISRIDGWSANGCRELSCSV